MPLKAKHARLGCRWVVCWMTETGVFAQVAVPAQIADHLAKRDLTYAALFVAALSVGATIYMGRLLYAAYQQNREDFTRSTDAVDRLTDVLDRRPCAMREAGYTLVMEAKEPGSGEGHRHSGAVREDKRQQGASGD